VEREELAKERARIVLDRYGVVFRQLLARELPALSWSRLFRSLRLMELSGEVLGGRFFQGVPGLQFASHAGFRTLSEGLRDDAVWWLCAIDPASPCGLGLDELPELPPRGPSTHLVYHGHRRVVTSRRRGGELEIAAGPDHPRLADYLGFLGVLLTRAANPVKVVKVETVNGEPAAESGYVEALGRRFEVSRQAGGAVRLRRRYFG